jgi:transcriptional regulator with XRE-family HTH domain
MAHPLFSREYKILREMLVVERRKRGLTQIALAKKMKITQSYISKIECGERRMDVFELLKLASAIGFDPAKFVGKLSRQTRFPISTRLR